MSDECLPTVLMVGEIAAHVQAVAEVMAGAPPEVHGPNRFITAGLDISGRRGVDNLVERVFTDPTARYLTYVVVVELLPGGRLSDQAADLLNARKPFALLGWAPADDYTPLACQGLDCRVGPAIQRTVEESARIWDVFDKLNMHMARLVGDHGPLRLAVVTGMADVSGICPITDAVFAGIPGVVVATSGVVGLDADAARVREVMGVFRHGFGGVIIAAVARVQQGDLTEFDRALAWLAGTTESFSRVMVALVDDAGLPGFEAAVTRRVTQRGVTLCYGPPNLVSFLASRVMEHAVLDEAYRVRNPRVPLRGSLR